LKDSKKQKNKTKKVKKEKIKKYDELEDIRQMAFMDGYVNSVKLAIAKRLLKMGVDIEIITQATYLTSAEIENSSAKILSDD
jgi:predicted transposase/invertase (TIGR01784 family)